MATSAPGERSPKGGNEENDDTHENSPESAGLARGLARSAVPKGAGRVALGRLPLRPDQIVSKAASKTSRVASRTRMSRIQRVAKVSDRASTGFDFVEAHQESAESSTSVKKESWRMRASNFMGSLAKNTILGMAVFATYEEAIDRFEISKENDQEQQASPELMNSTGQGYNDEIPVFSTQLSHHFAAGFCAGSVHAGVGGIIESFVSLVWQPLQNRFLASEAALLAASNATKTAFFPSLLNHATSHAVLFGSYETIRRTAMIALSSVSTTQHTQIGDDTVLVEANTIEDETDRFIDRQLVAVGLAGGTAGIFQQITSDVTDQVTKALQRERTNATKGKGRQQHLGNLVAAIRPPRYSAKSLFMLSLPTSIGFVAFEYGKEALTVE